VRFEQCHRNARARQQERQHYTGRSSSYDAARRLTDFISR
jgi:hypothetical protein